MKIYYSSSQQGNVDVQVLNNCRKAYQPFREREKLPRKIKINLLVSDLTNLSFTPLLSSLKSR
jgi:hypothetical protein